jgi:hypothetical protein
LSHKTRITEGLGPDVNRKLVIDPSGFMPEVRMTLRPGILPRREKGQQDGEAVKSPAGMLRAVKQILVSVLQPAGITVT